MSFSEKNSRSIFKTISYRMLIVISNFTISYILTGSIDLAAEIALFTFLINALLYFFHERAWNTISWGRKKSK